jgi:hypothetical protein
MRSRYTICPICNTALYFSRRWIRITCSPFLFLLCVPISRCIVKSRCIYRRWRRHISLRQTVSSQTDGDVFSVVAIGPWLLGDSEGSCVLTGWTVFIFASEGFVHWVLPAATCGDGSALLCYLTEVRMVDRMTAIGIYDGVGPTHLLVARWMDGCLES